MVWEPVYADGLVILRSALVCKPEVLWRLAKLKNLRGINWLKLVLCSSGRRLTCQTSVDNPFVLLVWDAVLQAHPSHLHGKKPLKQAWVRFLSKQENLRGTGRLHSLFHFFVPRSDTQAMFEDSIKWYGRPFMQTDGLICVLHANNRKCYGD